MPSNPAPAFVPLDSPENTRALLREKLAELQGRKTCPVNAELMDSEEQWQHLTNVILERAFGQNSTNLLKFRRALNAGGSSGIPRVPYGRPAFGPSLAEGQRWFAAR